MLMITSLDLGVFGPPSGLFSLGGIGVFVGVTGSPAVVAGVVAAATAVVLAATVVGVADATTASVGCAADMTAFLWALV